MKVGAGGRRITVTLNNFSIKACAMLIDDARKQRLLQSQVSIQQQPYLLVSDYNDCNEKAS